MSNKERRLKLFGTILLISMIIFYPYIARLTLANNIFSILVLLGYFLLIGLALCLLGVVKPIDNPSNILVPIIVIASLFLPNLFNHSLPRSTSQWYWIYISHTGYLLFALCIELVIWSVIKKKKWKRIDLSAAISFSAIVVLGFFHTYITREILRAVPINLLKLTAIYAYMFGALILPFLKKDRVGGILLLAAGGIMLAGHILGGYTPFLFMNFTSVSVTRFQSFMRTFANSNHYSLVAALIFAGLWCVLPSGICGRRRDMIESGE